MDNKHWLYIGSKYSNNAMSLGKTYAAKALNGYENFLKPKRMVKDIAYWVNHYITKD